MNGVVDRLAKQISEDYDMLLSQTSMLIQAII